MIAWLAEFLWAVVTCILLHIGIKCAVALIAPPVIDDVPPPKPTKGYYLQDGDRRQWVANWRPDNCNLVWFANGSTMFEGGYYVAVGFCTDVDKHPRHYTWGVGLHLKQKSRVYWFLGNRR